MTYLLNEHGTRYNIEWFHKQRGIAKVQIVMVGVIYPTVYQWPNCTLVLGETRIEGVKAAITHVQIDNPLNDIDPCLTRYELILTWRGAA